MSSAAAAAASAAAAFAAAAAAAAAATFAARPPPVDTAESGEDPPSSPFALPCLISFKAFFKLAANTVSFPASSSSLLMASPRFFSSSRVKVGIGGRK